ncbi:MAG: hypothetical protein QNJ63_10485 [Calothrix sp. MO_192.B10]|nr:hypothetical protein [Calothrix sp. MO_192.B10]
MKPNNVIALAAFLTALQQLDNSLPENIQRQLNEIGKSLTKDPDDIDDLDIIAEIYAPLEPLYQKELANLYSGVGERSKGLEPDPLPTNPTNELTNTAINTFNSPDSVSAAKKNVNPNLLKRIRNFIIGKQTNG